MSHHLPNSSPMPSSLPETRESQSRFATDPLLVLLAGFLGLTGRSIAHRATRDERGLSQSTENAILLAGAVTIAGIVVSMVTLFVKSRLPR